MNFFKYIKAVGTGPKSNRDLTKEETLEAIQGILEQKCESEQASAFLMLLRVKLEANDELEGCLEAFDKYIKRADIPESIELGYSYDGKLKQPYLFPLYSSVLKDFFKNNKEIEPFELVISGDYLQPAKEGITVKDIVTQIDLEDNIHFFNRQSYFKELSDLTDLRHKLYMRTILNTTEKLLNPAKSKYAITSAFHKPYGEKYINLFGKAYENLIIVKGSEGACEVFKSFKYWEKQGDEIVEKKIKLEDFDIHYDEEYENLSLEDSLKIIKNPSEELMKIVKLNVAVLLYTAKRVESIEKAYELLNKKDCCVVRFWKWLLK